MLVLQDLPEAQRARVIERLKSRGLEFNCFPLATNQRRLWFFSRLFPDAALYSIPTGLRLDGPLDAHALAAAVDAVVQRHESLRCQFLDLHGDPAQMVLDPVPGVLRVAECRGATLQERWDDALRLAREDCRRGFDIARGEVFRALLLRADAQQHLLVLNLHHIVSDAWSVSVLIADLKRLYETGPAAALAALPLQYPDYALWEAERSNSGAQQPALDYWSVRLAGDWVPTAVPPSGGDGGPAHAGDTRTLRIEVPDTEGLRRLCAGQGVTLQSGLLAAFKLLLWCYAGPDDVVIGSPVNLRDRAELEPVIGFFINTVVLRTRLAPGMRVRELLRACADTLLGALSNAELPFDTVVDRLCAAQPRRDRNLFHAMFAAQPLAASLEARMGEVGVCQVPLNSGTAKLDLALFIGEAQGGAVAGTLEYATAKYGAAFIDRLLRHYRGLIAWMAGHPDAVLDQAELLAPDERAQLRRWGGPARLERAPADLLGEFSRIASQRADRVAVSAPDGTLTYAQLMHCTLALQQALRTLGVGPESRVAVHCGRSRAMVVAVLGVLAAGGAYVPLDPQAPPQRNQRILQDSAASVLLSDGEPGPDGIRPLALDPAWLAQALAAAGSSRPPHRPFAPRHPDQAAYVIYTSGSTGMPKGVVVADRGMVALVHAQIRKFAIGPEAVVMQFASLGFDASVSELFTALLAGARLAVPAAAVRADPPRLAAFVAAQGVTHATLPPSLLAVLPEQALAPLPVLVSAGEPLVPQVGRLWARGRRLINAYGPTEATVCATCGVHPPERDDVSVGRPLEHLAVAILNHALQPVPVGVSGMLYLSGCSLARGYWRRPGATAASFIPDPHAAAPGARMYRTGDLARWREDGEIDLLGRVDQQVKLRGVRVELGEVEAALRRCPGVRDVAVVLQDSAAEVRLVAYVVGPAEHERLAALQAELLPEVMQVRDIVSVDALPLNASGKVDRQALAALAAVGGETRTGRQLAPRTDLERQVAAAWAEVLRGPAPGLDDHFFQRGGNSLLAIKLCHALESRLGRPVPLSHVFQHPMLGALAERLVDAAPRPAVQVLRTGSGPGTLVLVPALMGDLHSYRFLVEAWHGEPVIGLLPKPGQAAAASLAELAAAWLDELVGRSGPLCVCGWSYGAVVAIELANALADAGRRVRHLMLIEPSLHGDHGGDAAGFDAQALAAMPDLPARTAHERALLRAYLPGRVVADRVSVALAQGPVADVPAGRQAWQDRVAGELEFLWVPGACHASILRPPHVRDLAAAWAGTAEPVL